MKISWLAKLFPVALGGLLMANAHAADLALNKAPPYLQAAPAFNWSGMYIGLEAGWGISSLDLNSVGITTGIDTSAGALGSNASGGVGGVTLQFRQQPVGSSFVWGIKGAFDLTGINSTGTNGNVFNFNAMAPVGSVSIPWDARIVGEVGFAVFPQLLVFANGGVAIGDIKHNVAATVITPDGVTSFGQNTDNTHVGWTVGAGFDYALGPQVTAGFEWNYVNLGHRGVTLDTTAIREVPTAFIFDDTVAYNKFMGTLKYHF